MSIQYNIIYSDMSIILENLNRDYHVEFLIDEIGIQQTKYQTNIIIFLS